MFLLTSECACRVSFRQEANKQISKMESFIRSKYESRRWALEGPPPEDPSVLDNGSAVADHQQPVQQTAAAPIFSIPSHARNQSQSSHRAVSPKLRSSFPSHQGQAHTLLSTAVAERNVQALSPAAPISAPSQIPSQPLHAPGPPDNDLFSLDFHASTSVSTSNSHSSQPQKDVKQDILSLFSATPVAAPRPPPTHGISPFGHLHQTTTQSSPWNTIGDSQTQRPAQVTSMIGSNGVGQWGANSGWNAPTTSPPAPANLWGNQPPVQQTVATGPSNIWGSTILGGSSAGENLFGASNKQDDVFGDLWGGFK
jgi:stromal membrane-associated protein